MNTSVDYTPAQWVLIDAASQFGLDKKTFDDRLLFGRTLVERMETIELTTTNIKEEFKDLIETADEPEMFAKALLTINDILEGRENGHLIGLDAASSGPQLLSVLGGCVIGMSNTGVLGDNVPDLYTTIYNEMDNDKLVRAQVKKACVPYVYGSDHAPEAIFGDDAEEFTNGYSAAVPFAAVARDLMINCWNKDALFHEFPLPDAHIAHIEVRVKSEVNGKLLGKSYTYITEINAPKSRGKGTKSLAANITHGWDAFMVREKGGRANYNYDRVMNSLILLDDANGVVPQVGTNLMLKRLELLSKKFNFVSVEGLQHVECGMLADIDPAYLKALSELAMSMLHKDAYPIRTIHDEFAAHANNLSHMKNLYNVLLVESYASSWLFDTIESLCGMSFHHLKPAFNQDVSDAIGRAKYAIH